MDGFQDNKIEALKEITYAAALDLKQKTSEMEILQL
jgi:hypothetical protein